MSPLQINILLHYWARCDDYNEGDFSAPAVRDAIDDFHERGLLFFGPASEKHYDVKYHANRTALELYVRALEAVPLPVLQWVIPDRSAA